MKKIDRLSNVEYDKDREVFRQMKSIASESSEEEPRQKKSTQVRFDRADTQPRQTPEKMAQNQHSQQLARKHRSILVSPSSKNNKLEP